jgi:glucokinase
LAHACSTKAGNSSQASFGVDLGGTSTRVGFFDEHMQLRATRTFPTVAPAGPHSAIARMAEAVQAIVSELGIDTVHPIGIGSPGPINLRDGILGSLPNLSGWDNFHLRAALSQATGAPVLLESDANAAAIAEWQLGAGRSSGVESMAMITLGTGVGSGLILNGRVWHGMFGMGGELGHATVAPEGEACPCGSRGCLERYAAAGAVVRSYRRSIIETGAPCTPHAANPDSLTAHDVSQAAEDGDAAAVQAYDTFGHYLGIGLSGLINLLDLPLIIVGGGVAEAWGLFSQSMFESVRHYSVIYRLLQPTQLLVLEPDRTAIVPASLGPSAGLIGAALLSRLPSKI